MPSRMIASHSRELKDSQSAMVLKAHYLLLNVPV